MKANYGIDAPGVVTAMLLIGGTCLLVALLFHSLFWLAFPGASMALTGLIMIYGSKVGKLRMRDKLLDSLCLQGDEHVLDVGCGRGLMMIGAARRLTSGEATGIDLWQTRDQSGNSPETTLANAKAEGAESKIKIHTGDARKMPFEDNAFDLVLSSWALHNIPDKQGRREAVAEIVRVLKPGGRIAIMDLGTTREYAAAAREIGLAEISVKGPSFLFVTPTWTLTASKIPHSGS